MDISNIPQNLIKALEQKNTEQLAALSRVLNLVIGKTLMASVTGTEAVSPPERAALLKQTQEALAQITSKAPNPAQMTPALKAEVARLLQQQALVQSPQLKWVNLVVNGKPLITYTDKALSAGQAVALQLQSPQKLVLMDLPEASQLPEQNKALETPSTKIQQTAKPSDLHNQKAASETLNTKTPSTLVPDTKTDIDQLLKAAILELIGKSQITPNTNLAKNILAANAPAHLLKTLVEVLAKNDEQQLISDLDEPFTQKQSAAPATQETYLSKNSKLAAAANFQEAAIDRSADKKIIGESLKQLLPLKDLPNHLLMAAVQLQSIPAASRQKIIPANLEQALKSIAEKIRSPEQLSQPKILAQTIKNSGIFFESKLSQWAKSNINTQGSHSQTNTHPNAERIYSQDLKGSLLTLLSRATQNLSPDNKPPSSVQTLQLVQQLISMTSSPLSDSTSNAALSKNIGGIIQQLMGKPIKDVPTKELRSQLLALLQQHSIHSLAKIQFQQLRALSESMDSKETAAAPAAWQLDIPVKYQDHLHQIQMRIDREWIDEKKETESTKAHGKVKQWSVTLRFDLPSLGEFCAQLAIVDTRVSATLWAAQEKTFARVGKHLTSLREQLESEGITVKQLQCLRGMPPEKPLALSYSLIDVST